jgi:hypothetical protein
MTTKRCFSRMLLTGLAALGFARSAGAALTGFHHCMNGVALTFKPAVA